MGLLNNTRGAATGAAQANADYFAIQREKRIREQQAIAAQQAAATEQRKQLESNMAQTGHGMEQLREAAALGPDALNARLDNLRQLYPDNPLYQIPAEELNFTGNVIKVEGGGTIFQDERGRAHYTPQKLSTKSFTDDQGNVTFVTTDDQTGQVIQTQSLDDVARTNTGLLRYKLAAQASGKSLQDLLKGNLDAQTAQEILGNLMKMDPLAALLGLRPGGQAEQPKTQGPNAPSEETKTGVDKLVEDVLKQTQSTK